METPARPARSRPTRAPTRRAAGTTPTPITPVVGPSRYAEEMPTGSSPVEPGTCWRRGGLGRRPRRRPVRPRGHRRTPSRRRARGPRRRRASDPSTISIPSGAEPRATTVDHHHAGTLMMHMRPIARTAASTPGCRRAWRSIPNCIPRRSNSPSASRSAAAASLGRRSTTTELERRIGKVRRAPRRARRSRAPRPRRRSRAWPALPRPRPGDELVRPRLHGRESCRRLPGVAPRQGDRCLV